jgi:4-hydroxy-4-methyl-2-oxoglutarate aldolase
MPLDALLNKEQIEALRHFDTCMVSNAIETFELRLRNTGFAASSIRSVFEDWPPMVGYAATARLRTSDAPISNGAYHDRTDWWKSILQVPEPRIVVIEDMDEKPGLGAFVGDVHAAILRALGCVGYVTNGAVREIPRVREQGFYLFAGNIAVSHAYAHIFDFGARVHVGGLEVQPGDLLHGDQHGLLSVPTRIAAEIPAVAARLQATEQRLIEFCQSREFSVDALREITRELR